MNKTDAKRSRSRSKKKREAYEGEEDAGILIRISHGVEEVEPHLSGVLFPSKRSSHFVFGRMLGIS